MPFDFTPLGEFRDVLLIQPTRHGDARGWFVEVYKRSTFTAAGIDAEFRQENHSLSATAGTLRGLHYQDAPLGQGKLVRVVAGEVFDVVVDLRPRSPTYGTWAAANLAASDGRMLWVPDGFAHGFQTLVDATQVVYLTTAEYSPAHERGISWEDPGLGIQWPIREAILSGRDRGWPPLTRL